LINSNKKNYLNRLSSQTILKSEPPSDFNYFLPIIKKHIFAMASIRRLALYLGALLPAVLAAPTAHSKLPEAVPNKFIITLKEGASVDTDSHLTWVNNLHSRSLNKRSTAGIEKTYNIHTWSAYAGEFDEETIEQIKTNPDVRSRLCFRMYQKEKLIVPLGCFC
jgi:hypothetical protein